MIAWVVWPLLHGEAPHRMIKLSGVGEIMYVCCKLFIVGEMVNRFKTI